MFPKPIEKWSPFSALMYKFAVPITTLFFLIPVLIVLWTSIHTGEDIINGNRWGPPTVWSWGNYITIFTQTDLAGYFINSFLIVIPVVIGSVSLATLAGYGLGKFNFKANVWLFALFVGGNFVPFQILMIPVRQLMETLGLYNTLWGLVLFHTAFQTGFATLFMRNFIAALPTELIESARVEGVGEFKIFWYIVVPLMRPALAAISVLIFVIVWNDFFWALVLITSDSYKPITSGIQSLKGQWATAWQLITAASVIAALPPVVLFFFMQKHFVTGFTLGATKG